MTRRTESLKTFCWMLSYTSSRHIHPGVFKSGLSLLDLPKEEHSERLDELKRAGLVFDCVALTEKGKKTAKKLGIQYPYGEPK